VSDDKYKMTPRVRHDIPEGVNVNTLNNLDNLKVVPVEEAKDWVDTTEVRKAIAKKDPSKLDGLKKLAAGVKTEPGEDVPLRKTIMVDPAAGESETVAVMVNLDPKKVAEAIDRQTAATVIHENNKKVAAAIDAAASKELTDAVEAEVRKPATPPAAESTKE
jgi:hypothetical protein